MCPDIGCVGCILPAEAPPLLRSPLLRSLSRDSYEPHETRQTATKIISTRDIELRPQACCGVSPPDKRRNRNARPSMSNPKIKTYAPIHHAITTAPGPGAA